MKKTALSTRLNPSKVWELFVGDVYSIFKCIHLEKVFHHFSTLLHNIRFTIISGHLFETGFLYWYIGSLRILTNTYTTALDNKQVGRTVLFAPCITEHIPLSPIKMT